MVYMLLFIYRPNLEPVGSASKSTSKLYKKSSSSKQQQRGSSKGEKIVDDPVSDASPEDLIEEYSKSAK
jgi:hypothetical protein